MSWGAPPPQAHFQGGPPQFGGAPQQAPGGYHPPGGYGGAPPPSAPGGAPPHGGGGYRGPGGPYAPGPTAPSAPGGYQPPHQQPGAPHQGAGGGIPGYGTPGAPPQHGYGQTPGAPPPGAYRPPGGVPPQQFGQQHPGQHPPHGGYGATPGAPPPQQGGYGAQPHQQPGYGAPPPQQAGYGAPPPQQQRPPAYGAPPGSYGAPAAAPPPGVSPDLWQWFQAVDVDRSGKITSNELQSALMNGNWTPFNPETCRLMIGMFDRDRNGTIDIQEFAALWKYIQDWKGCFDRFDTDRSGNINANELQGAFQTFGYNLSINFCFLCVRVFDKHQRQSMKFDDFIQCCVMLKSLTDKFKEKDTQLTGQITVSYEDFLKMALDNAHP